MLKLTEKDKAFLRIFRDYTILEDNKGNYTIMHFGKPVGSKELVLRVKEYQDYLIDELLKMQKEGN